MSECQRVDGLVTPYVDGAISEEDRERIERHLVACPPCRRRVKAEESIHALIRARQSALRGGTAPSALRARCASAGHAAGLRVRARGWTARLVPLALAASLVAIVAGAFLYEITAHSTRLLAAELTADHLKCFRVLNAVLGTDSDPAAVSSAIAARFDWPVQLPEHPERAGLELVGARPCLYAEGLVAHIMYLHRGHPVSIFMLPRSVRADELVDVMGHQASIWSMGGRTFVLITREPRTDVEQIASFVHATLR